MDPTTPPLADPGMQFGPYLLRQRLGLGGMASVWKALDDRGRTLVVKRILPHLAEDPEFVEMFVREAALSARMRHPNIVRVFDHGDYEGERYLAMEFLHGRDVTLVMQEAVRGGAAPNPALAAFVARQLCRALSFVHSLTGDAGEPLHLIHRDVSLANVMIGYDGEVKLLDFGVAKALAADRSHRTAAGVLKGKWAYLAPEQVEGVDDVDHRADLFSLGIVLHEMLSGRRLFKAPTGLATLERVRAARVPAPSALNPLVPAALDAVCLRALARRPADRFQSAAEMAAALDAATAGPDGFGVPELALQMRALFPAESAAFHAQQALTPAGEWLPPGYDDGDTLPAPRLAADMMQEAVRLRIGRIAKLRRSRGWRVAMAATMAIALGGITGWQIARAANGGGKAHKPAPPAVRKTSARSRPASLRPVEPGPWPRLAPVIVRTGNGRA
jgi:eukaryotic-like serine/threonine-protein kinase